MAKKSRRPAAVAAAEGAEAPIEGAAEAVRAAPPSLGNGSLGNGSLGNGAFSGAGAAALYRSSLVFSSGAEAVGKELIELMGTALGTAGRTTGALLGARTMGDVVELNAELVRTTVESLLLRSVKLSEIGIAVAREAMAPFGRGADATPTGPRQDA